MEPATTTAVLAAIPMIMNQAANFISYGAQQYQKDLTVEQTLRRIDLTKKQASRNLDLLQQYYTGYTTQQIQNKNIRGVIDKALPALGGLGDKVKKSLPDMPAEVKESPFQLEQRTERDKYLFEAQQKLNAYNQQINSLHEAITQRQYAVEAAEEQKGMQDVLAAARGAVGGAGTSAGAVGQKLDTRIGERKTELGYTQAQLGATEQEKATLFGSNVGSTLGIDNLGGLMGQGWQIMMHQQYFEEEQIKGTIDVYKDTLTELDKQKEEVEKSGDRTWWDDVKSGAGGMWGGVKDAWDDVVDFFS